MTFLVAWVSLSVGIVVGAAWRSLCEKQSRRNINIADGSTMLERLHPEPRSWHRQLDRAEAKRRVSA
jgi:hypothetical protein